MSLIESNSTKLLLAPNAVFQGKALKPDVKYITIQITASFTGGNSGLLEIFYSIDGIYYDTYGDSWTYTTETNEAHIFKETQMKGSYFYVKWTNNGISQYTTFNLNTKLTTTTSTVSIDGVINIPTVSVDIDGQTVFSKIKDSNGNVLNSSDGSLYVYDVSSYLKLVDINNTIQNKTLSKTTSSIDISGQRVDISGQRVDISGQRVIIDISGQMVDISGQRVITDISGQRVDISGQRVITDISGQRVDISGQTLRVSNLSEVPLITGYSTESKQDTQIEELEKVVNKKGDIEADVYYNQGALIWADSVPEPDEYELNPNGWVYTNAEAGNAMNLFYFNGANETKLLNQLVGQYAVVSNLSTKQNNKMILAVYTKGSPFFTSRVTRSPTSGVNMVAGGKYLLYWGSVADDIYPNLPRLNFTSVGTTGPAVGTEEILSVSLNTDSSTPAGDLIIFIESLGVVFSDGSVSQSRVLNLLSNKTDYVLNASNTQFNQLSLAYLNNLNKTNGGLDVYIQNSNIAISNTSFEVSNFPTSQNCFITNDGSSPVPISGEVSVSNTVDVLITNVEPIYITGTVDINTLPSVDISNDFTLNTTTEATNTKLDTIHTDLDGLTFDESSNLNVNIASGSLTVDSVKIKASNGDNLTATSLGGSKSGLDTASNIYAYAGDSTRTAITCDSAGKLNVRSHNNDYLGNGITSTTTSIQGGATNSLDTASALYVSNGNARTALTATGSSLNTNITNTVGVSGTVAFSNSSIEVSNFPATQPVSGTVAFSNSSIEVSNFPATQPVSGTVAISNSSIDSHIYGSSNGNDWHHILSTPQGRILNNSSTQDGNGTGITSTLVSNQGGDKQGLDVFVANTTQSRVFTDLGNATGTDITATRIALDTASSLYTADGTNRNNLTSTAISSIRALDVNVANSGAIPVSGTVAFSNTSIGISGTVATVDISGNALLNTINQGVGYSYIESAPVPNNTIAGNTIGTYATWTRGQYRKTVFNYSDGNTSNTDSVSIYTKDILGGSVMIATFYPYVIGGTRQYSGVLELGPFNTITVRNNSSSSISGVSLKIFSA